MKDKNRLWILFTRKLAGEAATEELAELEVLLKNNPDQSYPVEVISDWWKLNTSPKKQISTKEEMPQLSARLERMMKDEN